MSTSEQPVGAGTEDYQKKILARVKAVLDEQPEQIGPYRILERLGGGGMGEVYRAEQRTPIRREVALKLIKLGMDTKLVIARFEAERQALAMMDHPHIAKVHDAGAEETGRPYFIMEYVKGRPITEYADQNHLNIQERLELFEQVCHAIQHAHHKGIIHRDLKPSNVLVSTQDGKPFAKVIDFGIAKATAQRLTDKTLYTQHEQLLGTPQYMSPEQAEGSLDIDTRTDVYSLGILLYELLAGSTPFDSADLKAAAIDQIKKMIREVDPPKPSTRISMSGNSLTTIASSRRTEPKKLGLLVRGELDWIVMKSLEKDRARRYETPVSLADDVRRYLVGQPVMAAPPSWAYRVRKYVRRRKGAVAAVAAIAALLIAATTVSTLLAVRANRAERQALDEKLEAQQQRAEAQLQRDRAEAEATRATSMFRQMSVDAGLEAQGINDFGLAMLYFAKAWELNSNFPEQGAIERKRISTLFHEYVYCPEAAAPNSLALLPDTDDDNNSAVFTLNDLDKNAEYVFRQDGKMIASCDSFVMRLWDGATGQLLAPPMLRPDNIPIQHCDFTTDGRFAIGSGVLFNVENGAAKAINLEENPTPLPMNASSDGKYIVAEQDGACALYDAQTGKVWLTITSHGPHRMNDNFSGIDMSANGKYLTYLDSTKTQLWDILNRRLIAEIDDNLNPQQPRFSPDGNCLALNHVGLISTSDGQIKQKQPEMDLACFSPDNKRLFVSAEHDARVVDISTGKAISQRLLGLAFNSEFSHAGFSADGKLLVTADTGNSSLYRADQINLWDATTGKFIAWIAAANHGSVKAVNFGPEGNQIVVAGSNEATVWNIEDLPVTPGQMELLAEYLSGRRIGATGEIAKLSSEELESRRQQLAAECPQVFQGVPVGLQTDASSPKVPEVSPRYQQAVAAQVAAAKTEDARKQLSLNFSRGAYFERLSGFLDEAILLSQTAATLDHSNLEAQNQTATAYLETGRYDDALAIYEKYDIPFDFAARKLIQSARDSGHDSPVLAKIEARVVPVSDSTVDAHDVEKLNNLVDKLGTVKGTVISIGPGGPHDEGTVLVLAQDPTFLLWIWNKDLKEFEKKFGVDSITTLQGKHIQATGSIAYNGSDMRITLDDPSQVEAITVSELVDFWDLLVANSSLPKSDYEAICEKLKAVTGTHAAENRCMNELGYVQYRLGQYATAITTLNRPAAMEPEDQNHLPDQGRPMSDWAFLAMTHYRLGHQAEAQSCLDKFHRMYMTGDDAHKNQYKALVMEADSVVQPANEQLGKQSASGPAK